MLNSTSLEEAITDVESQVKAKNPYIVLTGPDWNRWGEAILKRLFGWFSRVGYKIREQIPKYDKSIVAIVAERTPEADKFNDELSDEEAVRRDNCLSYVLGQIEGAHAMLKVKKSDWSDFRTDIVCLLRQSDVKELGYSIVSNFTSHHVSDVEFLYFAERSLGTAPVTFQAEEDALRRQVGGSAPVIPFEKVKIASYNCPICGYDALIQEPLYSYEECSCCGACFGVNDGDTNSERFVRRLEWLRRGAPWSKGFCRPGIWNHNPLKAALMQLEKANLLIPGKGDMAVSRFYEMEITIGGVTGSEELEKFREVIEEEWNIETFYEINSELTDVKNALYYAGRDFLPGGESESNFQDRICGAIWYKANRFLPIIIKATSLENIPSAEFHSLDEAKYKRMFPKQEVAKVEKKEVSEHEQLAQAIEEVISQEAQEDAVSIESDSDDTEPLPIIEDGLLSDDDETGPLPTVLPSEGDKEFPDMNSHRHLGFH